MNTAIDNIVGRNPLLSPEDISHRFTYGEAPGTPLYYGPNEEVAEMEEEISENNARDATIETIITALLTGTATGLSFSNVTATRQTEVTRLVKWLTLKLFTKINNQSLKAYFINFTNSFTTSTILSPGFIIPIINYAFDFKNRIVSKAKTEYQTWLSTKTNSVWAIKEYEPGALPFLTKYWNVLPTPPSPINSRTPWSAVFISWIIREAGAVDYFSYSNAHITYIRAARRNRRDNVQNPFWLYTINEFIPRMQPGDMLCKARDNSGLTFSNVLTHQSTAAHVDIIAEIDTVNNKIRVVGGNVCDNVDHKLLNIVGGNRITNSDNEDYFAGIGIGNA